ncbi:hypothetical protein V8C26DRAFT_388983 [Trichoderma gracile]
MMTAAGDSLACKLSLLFLWCLSGGPEPSVAWSKSGVCDKLPVGTLWRSRLSVLLARYRKVCAGDVEIGAPCFHSKAAVQGSVAIARQARGENRDKRAEQAPKPRSRAQISPSQGGI